jgi:hypothetical protein
VRARSAGQFASHEHVLRFPCHAKVAQDTRNDTYAFANALEKMSFENSPATRATVLKELRAYMAGPPTLGPYAVETDISKNKAILGGTVSHDTLERCRTSEEELRPSRLRVLYNFLVLRGRIFDPDLEFPDTIGDPIYRLLEHFFGVRPHNRDVCTLLDGNYGLYFRSEDINGSVIVGAMGFSRNQTSQGFEVRELQESTRPRRVERWNGYYFARRERIVIVTRGEGRILQKTPKFYVLNTPHIDDTEQDEVVSEIGGTMLKLGSGGSNTGAFSTKVLLRRDPDAFNKCNVVPIETIDPDIRNEL